jgi:23S rRNA pseudouridine1911/1915/1917 synthase
MMIEPLKETLLIPHSAMGSRADIALAELMPSHSRSRLSAWLKSGEITLDGRLIKPKDKVLGGETVLVALQANSLAQSNEAQDIALDIVYEDAAILVLNKPVGLVVHPGAGNRDGTLLNALLHHLPDLAQVPRAGIVHRLDKETSGLMVVAKTLEAQTHLVRQLQAHTVKREYLAVAYGEVDPQTVDAPIGRDPIHRIRMTVRKEVGKPARTHIDVLEYYEQCSYIRCSLETGRTHQIRVHLSHIGHPLVGDPVYCPLKLRRVIPFERQALHATQLSLVHPVTEETVTWSCEPPSDFQDLLDSLDA